MFTAPTTGAFWANPLPMGLKGKSLFEGGYNRMLRALRRSISALTLLATSGAGFAGVIDFNTRTGSDGDTFSTYTENGFTVTSTTGSWFKALGYGNPIPDIFLGPIGSPPPGSISVTDTGVFSFASIDFSSNNGTSAYSIIGFRGGLQQFNQTGTEPVSFPPFGFTTLASTNSMLIDTLIIGITPGIGTTSFNIDNIVVNAVPEPGTFGLLFLAILLAVGIQRKRTIR
jgi:hypothetical protein